MPRFSIVPALLVLAICAAAKAQAAGPVDQYAVREFGVGPLDASVPFEQGAVEGLLPAGVSVKWESVQFGKALPYPVMRVWDGPELLMELESYTPHNPRLTGITVLTPRIADAQGARVGASLKSLYHYGDRPDCISGVGRFSGHAICHAPTSTHIFYVFGGKKPAAENTLPTWAKLAKWRLVAIMWSVT